jgi:predicted lactoylglutathione lyase
MKPRINVITITVNDLQKSFDFYSKGLGWHSDGIIGADIENGAVAFFPLSNGLILALWPKQSLFNDANLNELEQNQTTSFSLGYNVNSKEDVDKAINIAIESGGQLVDPAGYRAWGGYSGYFKDLDGHLWDVVYNPELAVKE